jgi:hypothetical protein
MRKARTLSYLFTGQEDLQIWQHTVPFLSFTQDFTFFLLGKYYLREQGTTRGRDQLNISLLSPQPLVIGLQEEAQRLVMIAAVACHFFY